MYHFVFCVIFIFCLSMSYSQTRLDSFNIYKFSIEDGDTVVNTNIKNIIITEYESHEDKRQYMLTKYRVSKVYPYYLITMENFYSVNDTIDSFNKKRKKKKYIKSVEKNMKSNYMKELKALKISEGRVLIKLINRTTKQSTYDIIKSFRGGFSALFWQSLAKVYDNDLKVIYDPELNKEDAMIEKALIELRQNNIIQ